MRQLWAPQCTRVPTSSQCRTSNIGCFDDHRHLILHVDADISAAGGSAELCVNLRRGPSVIYVVICKDRKASLRGPEIVGLDLPNIQSAHSLVNELYHDHEVCTCTCNQTLETAFFSCSHRE